MDITKPIRATRPRLLLTHRGCRNIRSNVSWPYRPVSRRESCLVCHLAGPANTKENGGAFPPANSAAGFRAIVVVGQLWTHGKSGDFVPTEATHHRRRPFSAALCLGSALENRLSCMTSISWVYTTTAIPVELYSRPKHCTVALVAMQGLGFALTVLLWYPSVVSSLACIRHL